MAYFFAKIAKNSKNPIFRLKYAKKNGFTAEKRNGCKTKPAIFFGNQVCASFFDVSSFACFLRRAFEKDFQDQASQGKLTFSN